MCQRVRVAGNGNNDRRYLLNTIKDMDVEIQKKSAA
jgi:hypothetical protein